MAIQKLGIHGYRSFENAVWEPGKLNLLVGPNGSGKSNLLRLLELISDTARGRLSKAISDASGMVPLLWNQEAASFGWRIRLDPVDEGRDRIKDAVTLELDVAQLRGGSAHVINGDTLGNWFTYEQGTSSSPYWIYQRDERHAVVYDQRSNQLAQFEDFDANESLLSQISDVRTNPIPTYAGRVLRAWGIYSDIGVGSDSPMRGPVVTQHSTLVEPDGGNLPAVLHTLYATNPVFRRQIDDGMVAAFGKEFDEVVFPPAAAQRIQLGVQWRSSKQPHTGLQLSDGTLRFLFLLTVLANPEPGSLIAIDEPEAGLHPGMFPIVAEYALDAAERTQVVITSHSPEFLDSFTEYQPHVTVCHWEDGKSLLLPLAPDKLHSWLSKYRLGHLFASGDLDNLAAPDVERDADTEDRMAALPPESTPTPPASGCSEGVAHE